MDTEILSRERETLVIPKREMGPPVAQQVKNLPVMQETQEMQVLSLGQEDPLEEEMATHSSTLAWRISWAEEPGGLRSTSSQGCRVEHD